MFLTWSVCVSFVFCRRAEKVPGQCAVLQRDGRFVYYLVRSSEWTHTHRWHKRHSIWNVTVIVTSQVTKKRASQKPTYDSLTRSLEDMKSHCLRNEVTKISMPRFVFSFPLWLSATLSVSRLLRLQFKKNVSFFFPLSHQQHRLWPGSTGVEESGGDSGAGVQTHQHFHHSLQSSSQSTDRGDEGKLAQMMDGSVCFLWFCTFFFLSFCFVDRM